MTVQGDVRTRRSQMDTDIRILSTDLTEAVQSYIERRLYFSLGRFGRRVGHHGRQRPPGRSG